MGIGILSFILLSINVSISVFITINVSNNLMVLGLKHDSGV